MQSLKKLFYFDRKKYQKEYEERFNDENTIHLKISIGEHPAFFCRTVEMYQRLLSIEKTDKNIRVLQSRLPGIALKQFAQRCLISEIVLTNNIEGVHSTRKEIGGILSNLAKQDKRRRFTGLVKKYNALMTNNKIPIKTSEDIRSIYDDIFYEEIRATDITNLPDGKIFRANPVSVYSPTGKEIHRGVSPESRIISDMNKALDFLNDNSVDTLFRIAVFHYLFGYIHPFYDGNGRTSRFISSYLLSREYSQLIGYRISYTIKEKISKYYKAFDTCNSPMNKGDLTPFVEMFLNIVDISEKQLFTALNERIAHLRHYVKKTKNFPHSSDKNMIQLYDYLIQAALFSDSGISTRELVEYTKCSYNTVMKYLNKIPNELIIKEKQGSFCYYKLNLEMADKFE